MLPESTPVYTRWIWWIVWLPVISLVFATGYLVAVGNATVGMVSSLPMTTDPSTMSPQKDALSAQAVVSVLPWMFAIIPVGWGLTAVIVWFAYLDWRDLGRLGYARRFHWAWSFLGIVYPIGRSVVVKRQTGRGSGPMWASIWIEAGWFVIVIGWSIWLTIAFMQAAVERAGQVTGY